MKYIVATLFILFFSTGFALAQCEDVNDPRNASSNCEGGANLGTGGLQYSLESPLSPNIFSIESLVTSILNVLLVLAVPVIVFFIIFAGFKYVTARGNPEDIKTATRSLTYAIVGGVLILGGVAISEIIATVVESFGN